MDENSVATILEDLVDTLEDGREGFNKAAQKLEDDGYPELAQRMSQFSDERARLSAELREIAVTEGVEIEDSGSAAAALHRGWMSLADAVTGHGPHAVLSAAESGEDYAVGEFDKALQRDYLPANLRPVIVTQAQTVRSAHDEVRTLRDRAQ